MTHRPRRPPRRILALLTVLLLVPGCASAEDIAGEAPTTSGPTEGTPTPPTTPTTPPTTPPTSTAPPTNAALVMGITDPLQLSPIGDCFDDGCTQLLSAVFAPLFSIDRDTGALEGVAAEQVVAESASSVRITLRPGWTFHNGEPADAAAYVRGWNATAAGPDQPGLGYLFTPVLGYDDVLSGDAKEMTGLTVVDDLTIDVELTKPDGQWVYQLANAIAFAPLSEECAQSPGPCEDLPIGTGPFAMTDSWAAGSPTELTAYEEYAGERTGNVTDVSLVPVTDPNAAYAAWSSGELDVVDVDPADVPAAAGPSGDRLVEARNDQTTIGIPVYRTGFGKSGVRRALSLAVDREQIVASVFAGGRLPADDVLSPAVVGYEPGRCRACTFDPSRARALWQSSGGVPGNRIELVFSTSDPLEKLWVKAIATQWRETLGVEVTTRGREVTAYFSIISGGNAPGPFRNTWIGDAPVASDYLRQSYGPLAYPGFSSSKTTALEQAGLENPDLLQSTASFSSIAAIVADELPYLPLWSRTTSYLIGDGVSGVRYDALLGVQLHEVVVS